MIPLAVYVHIRRGGRSGMVLHSPGTGHKGYKEVVRNNGKPKIFQFPEKYPSLGTQVHLGHSL